jgi:hypothetical protein
MATAVLEQTMSRVGLHARCIEAAVHQPDDWKVVVDGVEMPVFVEVTEDESILSAVFIAGPMPEGDHFVMLEVDGAPMYGSVVSFKADSWWKRTVSARLG